MIKSMTGYGKAEVMIGEEKYLIEIRSLNGKNVDISIKTSFIPREKEIEVRQLIGDLLVRGNIDLFISLDSGNSDSVKVINKELLSSLYSQLSDIARDLGGSVTPDSYLPALLRVPDVIETQKTRFEEESAWKLLSNAIKDAINTLDSFRITEGVSIERDIMARVENIEKYLFEVEKYEEQRLVAIRGRILKRLEELSASPDENRFEQEMIYHIEKLDINEEKVRLRQHCNYFRETAHQEVAPGKKLGFIAQEMGREINTLGSKANHAEIQKWVVMMKDELEKIKELTLNII